MILMGSSCNGLVLNDFNKLIKAIELFYKKSKISLDTPIVSKADKEKYKQEQRIMITLPKFNRGLNVCTVPISEYLKELPKHSRKLKNAKSVIVFSLGAGEQATKLISGILQAHETNGYLQIQDTGYGRFQEVTRNGLNTKNLTIRNKPVAELTRFFNDLPSKVEMENSDYLETISIEDIQNIYYRWEKGGTNGEYRVTDCVVDIAITFKNLEKPPVFIYFTTMNIGYTITNSHIVNQFMSNVPKEKQKNIGGKDYCDIFTLS